MILPTGDRLWTNKHETVKQKIDELYDAWRDPIPDVLESYNDSRAEIQALIGKASNAFRLRALASGWSFSPVAATNGQLLNTKPLNLVFAFATPDPRYTGNPANVFFAQCGVSMSELNMLLAARGKSLKASGASNGQTIVGAMSTGTHGSAFDVGGIADFIVGMHVLIHPKRHIWLERQSYPVADPAFAQALQAELVRDDDLFNATLISFGSFGVILGVLLEAEDLYVLQAYRRSLPYDDNLKRAIRTLDFSAIALPDPASRPYHFEIMVNPYDGENVYVTTMYKRQVDPQNPTPDPVLGGGLGLGDDALAFIGTIVDLTAGSVLSLVTKLLTKSYRLYEDKRGTLGQIFSLTTTRGKAASVALGIPLDQADRVLDLLLQLNEESGPFPGVFACRFVKQTQATLGFTRFPPVTCVVDLDAVQSKAATRFYRKAWDLIEAEGIPYTVHWGKMSALNAIRVRAMYGDEAVERWIQARKSLLTPAMREVFSSPFLEQAGLG